MQSDQLASDNDPAAQPSDLASMRSDAAGSVDRNGLSKPPILPSVRLLAATALFGVALALVWGSTGIRVGEFLAASEPPVQTNPKADEQFARLVQELDAVRKSIGDLTVAQEQLNTRFAALQESQQELRQRASATLSYWYSEPALRLAIVTRSNTLASPRAAAGPADAPNRDGQRREAGRPLQLVAPRP